MMANPRPAAPDSLEVMEVDATWHSALFPWKKSSNWDLLESVYVEIKVGMMGYRVIELY